jgi:hypothetical protein
MHAPQGVCDMSMFAWIGNECSEEFKNRVKHTLPSAGVVVEGEGVELAIRRADKIKHRRAFA